MPLQTHLLRLSCVLSLAFTLASCSIGYHSDWKKAAASDATLRPKNLEGAWEGTWRSAADGHQGTLKAIVTSIPSPSGQPEKYLFRYHATWAKILSGTISAEHAAAYPSGIKGGRMELSGEKDLGRLGGVYGFTGSATPTEFKADYKSKLDNGVFEMRRPGAR